MNDAERTGAYQPGDSESPAADAAPSEQPRRIGRYRVERVLGEGGFGIVYLAHDEQLQRLVAIKVPHRRLVSRPEDAEAYLVEARTVANLDHPNIVPVFDVGSTDEFPGYVVSKFIDGADLAARLKQSRLSTPEAVELVATVAEALHHAHKRGLVHRDIKPGNLLLDEGGKPFVADFGLALREQDVGKGPRYAGTPAYMSPEQARGEGHRVDGRSDIFSLGVVFYELLVGRQPFRGESQAELMEQVTSFEARPPRQCDDRIPKELDRICLKALSKRASDRYSTAKDMADDLRHFLAEQAVIQQSGLDARAAAPHSATSVVPASSTSVATSRSGTPSATTASGHRAIKIVPKGLRSFDAHDSDFFLELLPGPRDRDGLPDSIRFWKTRIEEADADNRFSAGLICGPSGCGKSSLVKAGLLPRLSDDVIAVHVEATAEETETRLLNGLRKRCPALPDDLGLKDTVAAIRRGRGIPVGKKVVIFLDQFEQWLHAKKEEHDTELVGALRQCDGGRVQCVVMVRDDFWMAVIRFMRELEVRLLEGQNSAAVDLFDLDHARKVLAAFGRAFGKLPENPGETSKDHKEFLKQAVSGLAQEGKVICVRLALFAEMMKGKAWTPATLKEVGGTEGVGVTFLEETFSAATAPPEHRYHQKAARGVLNALLPESGTDIKGHMRSYGELLEASGYGGRSKDFDDLIRILDGEIRLITPTDPEGKEGASASSPKAGEKYYQLAHDYLVPSLRDWLTRKQKETRRGRAELLLGDRAAVWNARPENRQLPSLAQWFQIEWRTAKETWKPTQREMMRKAGRYHAMRGAVVAVVLIVATITGLTIRERNEARLKANRQQAEVQRKETLSAGLVQSVLNAETARTPAIVAEMSDYRQWVDPLLSEENAKPTASPRQKLHASLALLPVDPGQVDYLSGRLLDAQPHEVPVIRDALVPHEDALLDKLWAVVLTPERGKRSRRLRAAAALAKYDPAGEKWKASGPLVVDDLVMENPVFLGQWSEMYRPVRKSLLDPLTVIFRDRRPERAAERTLATNLLADYAADSPAKLADLLMDADDRQFAVIFPKFEEQGENGLPILLGVIDTKLPAEMPPSDVKRGWWLRRASDAIFPAEVRGKVGGKSSKKPDATTTETLAKRQANAAVALLRMRRPEKVWPLLKHSPDPRVRSYLIHRLSPLGADPAAIIQRLEVEPDLTIRRALLLCLGEFGDEALPVAARTALLPKLQAIYRTDADPGLHASAEWLLRKWGQEAWLKQVNEEWAADKDQREKRFEGIRRLVKKDRAKTPPQWYVNSQGQTFVVVPGPVEFVMGSPKVEKDHEERENPHKRKIGRSFAIASKSVTLAQYRSLTKDKYQIGEKYTYHPNLPVVGVTWYMAAKYCNLLSKEEGIPEDQWCYETGANGQMTKLKADYLSLTGYRLPTEAEMEYTTRAGATSSRYYGETEELLGHYAWYSKSSNDVLMPVGKKKPNDLGLFDVQGNCYTWCQEAYGDYPAANGDGAVEDKEGDLVAPSTLSRVLRGGSFGNPASNVRSAFRNNTVPPTRDPNIGFRPARTFTP